MPVDPNVPRPPYRKLGILYHHFPEMTRTEKGFILAFIACGVVLTLLTTGGKAHAENPLAGFCAATIGGVLCYWAKQEPAALLDFLIFPFFRSAAPWPRSVLFCVRAFGVVGFFGSVSGFLTVLSPAVFRDSLGGGFFLLAVAIAICFFFLRRRSRLLVL